MDKQSVAYQYNGILFINKKNKLLIHITTGVDIKNYAKGKIKDINK